MKAQARLRNTIYVPRQANLVLIAYASSDGSGEPTHPRSLAKTQCCWLIQAVSQEEPSDKRPDPWPLWMAGHVQLKFVMIECSKTQICLARHIWNKRKLQAKSHLSYPTERINMRIWRIQNRTKLRPLFSWDGCQLGDNLWKIKLETL